MSATTITAVTGEFDDARSLRERYPLLEGMTLEDLRWCHEADRTEEVFALERDPATHYEIKITSDIALEQSKEDVDPAFWELMEAEVAPLVGQKGYVLSSTFEGGGVAMQEPPALNLFQKLGVDIKWLVSDPDPAAFDVTKKMHNLQQDVLTPEVQFTEEDKAKHQEYGLANFQGMIERVPGFADADFYWIEDPQLAAMIPKLMEINPNARFIYRNHIQTDRDKMATEDSPQNRIYEYLRNECRVKDVDTYVAHPVEQFVPYGTPNVAYMPPTSELREDLNRPIGPLEKAEKKHWINGQVMKQNLQRQEVIRAEHLLETGEEPSAEVLRRDDQPLIDWDKKLLTGFARFDKAKGQQFNMQLQLLITRKLREIGQAAGMDEAQIESLIPHSIIAGNGATDDPDRNLVLGEMIGLTQTEFAEIKDHLTVIGLEHDYAAVNVLLSESMFTENFSTKEGFEHRRAEGMLKDVPSCSTDAGGLPLQGQDGEGGFVADLARMSEELDRIANEIVMDILDPERHQTRREQTRQWAREYIIPELTTVANITRFSRIVTGRAIENDGGRQWKMGELLRQTADRTARKVGTGAMAAS
jgi:trehalose synthase